jgi:two-component system chemotaxis response regulator CheB
MAIGIPKSGEVARVVLADSSPHLRHFLRELIQSQDNLLQVVGEASTGVDLIRQVHALTPHLIALECDLPLMDGFQVARWIMQENPTRLIFLAEAAHLAQADFEKRMTAVGVLGACEKPSPHGDPALGEKFIKTLKAMASVNVVRLNRPLEAAERQAFEEYPGLSRHLEIVLIVSSTGGPPVLEKILRGLPADFPLPLVIVQHISDGFVDSMTNWLEEATPLVIKMAEHGERPKRGHIYIAPNGLHLRLAYNGRFTLEADSEGRRHVPSGDVLFESAAETYGANAIGIVLTGMGMDGALGLEKLRKRGAHTILQDEASSAVYGMPKAARDLGAGEYSASPEEIARLLVKLVQDRREL